MIDTISFLDFANEKIDVPFSIITFFFIMYIVVYLSKKNPDIVRSKIFLNFDNFKKSFILLAIFAFILIFHIALLYQPHLFYSVLNCSPSFAYDLQRFFGLALSLVMISFVYFIFRSIK